MEVVLIAFAAAIYEWRATTILFAVIPPLVTATTRPRRDGLIASVQSQFLVDANLLAQVSGLKLVGVAETTAVNKLVATFGLSVEVPQSLRAIAGTAHFREGTPFGSFWSDTRALALFLRGKSVAIALAVAVPEPIAGAVGNIKVPLDREVTTWTSFFG